MEKIINLLNEKVTLLFDLGTHYIFAQLTDKKPIPKGETKGYEEARTMLLAAYRRYHVHAKTQAKLTDDQVTEEGFFGMDYGDVLDIVREYWQILTVKPNPDVARILEDAAKLEEAGEKVTGKKKAAKVRGQNQLKKS
jgi:hypothetical protein